MFIGASGTGNRISVDKYEREVTGQQTLIGHLKPMSSLGSQQQKQLDYHKFDQPPAVVRKNDSVYDHHQINSVGKTIQTTIATNPYLQNGIVQVAQIKSTDNIQSNPVFSDTNSRKEFEIGKKSADNIQIIIDNEAFGNIPLDLLEQECLRAEKNQATKLKTSKHTIESATWKQEKNAATIYQSLKHIEMIDTGESFPYSVGSSQSSVREAQCAPSVHFIELERNKVNREPVLGWSLKSVVIPQKKSESSANEFVGASSEIKTARVYDHSISDYQKSIKTINTFDDATRARMEENKRKAIERQKQIQASRGDSQLQMKKCDSVVVNQVVNTENFDVKARVDVQKVRNIAKVSPIVFNEPINIQQAAVAARPDMAPYSFSTATGRKFGVSSEAISRSTEITRQLDKIQYSNAPENHPAASNTVSKMAVNADILTEQRTAVLLNHHTTTEFVGNKAEFKVLPSLLSCAQKDDLGNENILMSREAGIEIRRSID